MNDYISLCGGDPCPPIFRSPIAGLEDIMDNQIICDIYRLPDAHKHITQPPVGVIFPKKIVSVGDLKPEPVLWHEDNGRKPWENGRQNLPGTISGRQLGEAAHRLLVNSLQLKVERNGFGDQMHAPPPCPAATYGPPLSSYSDDRYHTQEHHWMVLARQDYSDQTLRRTSYPTSVRNHFDHRYDQPYASSATGHHYNRSHQHERNNRSAVNSDPVHGYYQSGFHQNGGPGYHPRQVAQTHISTSAHLPGQGRYNSYISY